PDGLPGRGVPDAHGTIGPARDQPSVRQVGDGANVPGVTDELPHGRSSRLGSNGTPLRGMEPTNAHGPGAVITPGTSSRQDNGVASNRCLKRQGSALKP